MSAKKVSILGADTFNFIAQLASKKLNLSETPIEASLPIDKTVAIENIVKSSDIVSIDIKTAMNINETDSTLKTETLNFEEKEDLETSFKLLSLSADDEYKTKENYLKGCKWLTLNLLFKQI